MKKLIAFLFVLFSFASCDLSKLEPAQEKAFMKYFGDEGNTTAVDLLRLTDGYLLLGNNLSSKGVSAVIIKVDNAGNTLWTSNLTSFIGRSIAESADGYFIVGDGIDGTNPTSMRLIKTSLEGIKTDSTELNDLTESYHGRAVTVIESTGDVVVSGTIDNSLTSNQIFLAGYNNNLVPNWTITKFPSAADGNARYTSKNIFEDQSGNIIWSELSNSTGPLTLQARGVPPGGLVAPIVYPLFQNETLIEEVGDINSTNNDNVAAVQSIDTDTGVGIGVYLYSSQEDATLTFELSTSGNLRAGSVSPVDRAQGDEFLIVGSTDYHSGDDTRNDTDFYIAQVEFNGEITFENSFGGTGNESAVAVVPAVDGGFVILGTLRNTNDVSLMVLAKVNNNGELIN